jgi:hypothetical protein
MLFVASPTFGGGLMAESEDIKQLNMRIAKLEQALGGAAKRAQPTDLTADEIKTYRKVLDVIAADWGDFCGINDCFRCIINRCITRCITICRRCDIECSCGPCSLGTLGGIGRFGGLGE